MARRELLILQCPAGGGHRAAALAIAERAEARGVPSRVLDALSFAPAWFARLYVDTHLRSSAYLPHLYGGAYFASNHRAAVEGGDLRRWLDHRLAKDLLDEIVARDPLAVVATHFFPMGKLAWARRRGRLRAPLIEVVTDYAAHAVWAEPHADAYCAPAGRAAADLARHGVDPGSIVPTGIPVRAAFARIPAWTPPMADEPLRVLLTSGGFGVGPVVRALQSFRGVPGARLTVVCGDNPLLMGRARWVAERLGLRARIIGYESDMPARVAEAHVVVTKPGGLTVSETLAAGRPLVLVGAVPGQESLNQEWLVKERAGVACSADAVGHTVAALREGGLAALAVRARALGAPDAADRVVALAERLARKEARNTRRAS